MSSDDNKKHGVVSKDYTPALAVADSHGKHDSENNVAQFKDHLLLVAIDAYSKWPEVLPHLHKKLYSSWATDHTSV